MHSIQRGKMRHFLVMAKHILTLLQQSLKVSAICLQAPHTCSKTTMQLDNCTVSQILQFLMRKKCACVVDRCVDRLPR